MDIVRHGLLIGSAAVAGAINAVAGGGTLISFPAAMAWGLPSIVANVTNAVAQTPGSLASAWGYRRELRADWRLVRLLAPAAAASRWHCASAPARPPRSPPLPISLLVMKKVMACGGAGCCARANEGASRTSNVDPAMRHAIDISVSPRGGSR